MGFIFPIKIAGGSQWNAPFVLSLVMHAYAFVRSNNPWYAMEKQNMQSEKVCFLESIFWRNFNFFLGKLVKVFNYSPNPHSKISTPLL